MLFPIVLLALVGTYIFFYRYFIKLNNSIQKSWALVVTQLKKRYNLVPLLVKSIKQHAKEDYKILTDVTERVTRAKQSTTIKERQNTERHLSQSINAMFELADNLPELEQDEDFAKLRKKLDEAEKDIQEACGSYNVIIKSFNSALHKAPTSWVGSSMSLRDKILFELQD